MVVVVLALLLIVVSVGGAVLAVSERQFTGQIDPRPTADRHRVSVDVSSMPSVIASCIEAASRSQPRNFSEARSMGALRLAYQLAVDGDFEREVQTAIDRVPASKALHDVGCDAPGVKAIDHIVVTPTGVFVIDSVVRTAKVSVESLEVLVGRGRDQRLDPMIDHMRSAVAAVFSVVAPLPVSGVIVFRDLLSLPQEIRDGSALADDIRLLTLDHLDGCLAKPGPIVDLRSTVTLLRAAFPAALPSSRAGRSLLMGFEHVPPTT